MQTDLILRSALTAALRDLRAKPWLLEDIFSQCAQDTLLQQEFGYAEIERAKSWFLKTNVPVVMYHRLDSAELPCISIALQSSTEKIAETVLGDYSAGEEIDGVQVFRQNEVEVTPIVVLGPFEPKGYDPSTGTLTLPDDLNTDFVVPNQLLVDVHANNAYPIVLVTGNSTFTIAPNTRADFSNAIIMPRFQALGITRERAPFLESYQIGCHVVGDPVELLWLHSIVTYCLLRYKEAYLDRRGITRTTFMSSDFIKSPQYEPQNVFSRFITLSATVENNWVKDVGRKVEGIKISTLRVIDGGVTNPLIYQEEVKGQGWEMEDDPVEDNEAGSDDLM